MCSAAASFWAFRKSGRLFSDSHWTMSSGSTLERSSAASCWWVMPSRFLAHSMTFSEMSAALLGVVDFVATLFLVYHVAQENRQVYIVGYVDVSVSGSLLSRVISIRSTARELNATDPRLR